ncbi:MAG: NADH-quinone oxidoreductase subunit N [Candidatus Schekmanbacteria bacterium]|nr:NADH-quinone oxidoreductase subunit N [Candidatus Schekmanbacteria bacterium]
MIDPTSLNLNLQAVSVEIVLCVAAMIVLLLDSVSERMSKSFLAFVSIISIVTAFRLSASLWGHSISAFSNMLVVDNFSFFCKMVFLLGAGLTVMISSVYLRDVDFGHGEYYALVLFSTAGMCFISSAADFLILFIAIEIMSIAFYILCGFERSNHLSNESSLKYFLMGAFSSAFLLYGIALIYGYTGSTNFSDVAVAVSRSGGHDTMIYVGAAVFLIGLSFKIAAVPFHMWVPDVYQGAPTTVTAFMAAAGKAAGFAALLRVVQTAFPMMFGNMTEIFWVVCALTMTVGNVIALAQTNIKRMLAYSSIAHAGYILLAMVSYNEFMVPGVLFYLLAYTLMNIGAFAVIVALSSKEKEALNISNLAGVGAKYPLLAASMTIFMISLSGIPPTAGFVGKLYIFSSVIKSGFIWLAVIGVINSVISVFYYFRVIVAMYMREPEEDWSANRFSPQLLAVIFFCAAGIMIIGIFPNFTIRLAEISKIVQW